MLKVVGREYEFNGERVPWLLGRSSFKFVGWLELLNPDRAERWIAHNQRLGVRLLRVFLEAHYWHDHPMFGSAPRVGDGAWDYEALERGERPEAVNAVMADNLRRIFGLSEQTGMAFELVVDATLKGNVRWGLISHCFRVVLRACRELQAEFPRALVQVSRDNEWDAHSEGSWVDDQGNKRDREWALAEVNQCAVRARRWVDGDGVPKQISFESPGIGWEPEQWPEGVILVDHGGRDEVEYRYGSSPHDWPLIALHPRRYDEWWTRHDSRFGWALRTGLPVVHTESKHWVDPEDWSRAINGGWYSPGSSTNNLALYEEWLMGNQSRGMHFYVHDEKGMQSDPDWPRAETQLEGWLREAFGGGELPPPPPRPEFRHLIAQAYREVLLREPDAGGLEHYNDLMAEGVLDEASLRRILTQSHEFRERFL